MCQIPLICMRAFMKDSWMPCLLPPVVSATEMEMQVDSPAGHLKNCCKSWWDCPFFANHRDIFLAPFCDKISLRPSVFMICAIKSDSVPHLMVEFVYYFPSIQPSIHPYIHPLSPLLLREAPREESCQLACQEWNSQPSSPFNYSNWICCRCGNAGLFSSNERGFFCRGAWFWLRLLCFTTSWHHRRSSRSSRCHIDFSLQNL